MRRHKVHADPDIAPYLKPLRTSDCCVGVAVQELLAQRLGAGPDLPGELRFDYGESPVLTPDGGRRAVDLIQAVRQGWTAPEEP